ncbi:MAG: hypothetical protein ACRC5A_13360 [Enterobacteriaceae bacterium]
MSSSKASGKKRLTYGQKLFNKNIRKIEELRHELQEWQTLLPAYQAKYASELIPLTEEYHHHMGEMAQLLHKAYPSKSFSKEDKSELAAMIAQLASTALISEEQPHLKSLYNLYSGSDFDSEMAEEKARGRAEAEEFLGTKLDDSFDPLSKDAPLQFMEKMRDILQQESDSEAMAQPESPEAAAQEAQLKESALQLTRSVREVYRKLSTALHPDREQDAEKRQQKTELMKRVNIAYNEGDLLALLELQLEVEQIDQDHIATLPKEKLRHYNQILSEQIDDLYLEIEQIKFVVGLRFNTELPQYGATADEMRNELQQEIEATRIKLDTLKTDLVELNTINSIKEFLRVQRKDRDTADKMRALIAELPPDAREEVMEELFAFLRK